MADNEFKWKRDKWEDINDLINRWGRRHPEKMKQNLAYVQQTKIDLKDKKYAEWKDSSGHGTGMRFGLAIHPELMNYIETFYPEFMKTNEDVREFGRRFKKFSIPDKH